MTTRNWVFDTLNQDAAINQFVTGRVFQSTSLSTTPHQKPFIMYRQTSDVIAVKGSDHEEVRNIGYLIFVHDIPGSYSRIDLVMQLVKARFADTKYPPAGVIRSTWIDTSDDQRDEDMGTIMKFARIQVVQKV